MLFAHWFQWTPQEVEAMTVRDIRLILESLPKAAPRGGFQF